MTEQRINQYKQLGLTIAYYRKLKGITQQNLAEAVNLSRTHISNLEAPNMPTSISLEKLFDIAEVLGVDTTGMDQAAYRKAAVDAVRQLSVDVGIPTKLEKLKEEDLPFLCQSAAADACAPGNPRPATLEDFERMFRKLM